MMIRFWMRDTGLGPLGSNSRRFCSAVLWPTFVALVAFFTYEWILECSFTGTDVFALIESSQINSYEDLIRIFSGPLMQGTDFTSVARFYRPLATLSYSLDFWAWGLEPFGFQLTSLLLHVFVSICVFVVMRRLADGDGLFAAAAAALFAVHPILVESVPAIDRRHDLIASLFFLISLWCYLATESKDASSRRTSVLQALAVGAYVCALGGKEIAIILPGVMWCHAMLFRTGGHLKSRIKTSVMFVAPYIITSFLYVLWRIYILGGIGGYENNHHDARNLPWYMVNTIHCYFQDLVYPVDFGRFLEGECNYAPTAVIIAAVIFYVLFYFLGRGKRVRAQTASGFNRLALFLLVWLAIPLVLFIVTLTFSHRSMYTAVIPFAALVAGTAIESIRLMRAHMGSWQSTDSGREVSCRFAVIIAAGALCISLVAYSPLFSTYGQWKESARISTMFLERLAAMVQPLPRNCSIHVHELPEGVTEFNQKVPHAKEVTYLRDYAIKSWLNLQFRKNAIRIFVHKRSWPQTVAGSLGLSMLEIGHNSFHVFVEMSRPHKAFMQANRVHIARPFRQKSVTQ
ncbi:MAG: hypothetical protein LDL33_04000 [Desulfomonile sp.]|nr:hypothetical protein [Desulfomonile sp.]